MCSRLPANQKSNLHLFAMIKFIVFTLLYEIVILVYLYIIHNFHVVLN